MASSFRSKWAFGKRIEYWIVGQMLKEGLDVYLPLVDDDGIDGVIKKSDGTFTSFQVKARSKDIEMGDAALFSAIWHELREHYWFIFYSERMNTMWIMTSQEFIEKSVVNKKGKNVGSRSIWFNGLTHDKVTKEPREHVKPQWLPYVATNFDRIKQVAKGEINAALASSGPQVYPGELGKS